MSLSSSERRRKAVSMAITSLIVLAAIWAGYSLFIYYQDDPWTRDGRIRADIVRIAPDVGGLVTAVHFDHDQRVRRGDVLFEIDPSRYAIALSEAKVGLQQAEADLARARFVVEGSEASLAEARREAARDTGLGELLPSEATQQSQTRARELEASLGQSRAEVAQAQARIAAARNALDLARLNLTRTRVLAPVDGYLSDFDLRVGNYVNAGSPVLALVDTATLRVEGYFEETKLARVHLGQKALIHAMGEERPLHGHVISIAAGIKDHDRTGSSDLLPAINPSFSWVRLPQRVPVRIHIDDAPRDLALISGRTVSVSLAMDQAK
ncbi:HlyD family secretion protein [Novosphingobium profundi]|uniref:HlyD family efflux transporter periplasmic adaptor subunit n=1 Tax=Novosphingobium profundi TaxID=1774954 RepID=UPI001BDACA39|nr:HlyD family secretion protein [Novosphingobium profundi]MBT0669154.1 HlyD family secretion protein [Novosphingobium profundi]